MGIGKRGVVFAMCAAVAGVSGMMRASWGDVTLTKTSSSNWTINNGSLTVVFSPTGEKLTSLKVDNASGVATGLNLITSLDQEFAGTPFGAGPETFNSEVGANNSYVDVWTTVASQGSTLNANGTAYVNPMTYAFHYVLFAGDPTVHVYEVVNHSATDPTTAVAGGAISVGQGQFLFRSAAISGSAPAQFPQLYQIDTGPNNLAATLKTIPSTASNFGTVSGQVGRTVQDATTDLTGSGIAGDNGTNFYEKYDYSTYTQFFQAETMLGNTDAVSEVISSTESMTGGPTKQELAQTNPGILNLEFLSDHYGIDAKGSAFPGYAYTPTAGVDTTRLFGAYAFRVVPTNGESAAQINQDAIDSISNYKALYDTDAELVASGYVPSTARGSLQLTAGNASGWSANTTNNTVVLSQPGVNMQESTQGNQYWAQVNQNGTASISGAAPGTYRMTLYQLGQWGETRVDGVQVQSGQISIPQNVQFTPENFGSAAPIWTIGTPNRSANEFLNGHNADGSDIRAFQGSYDFWGEEQALGNPGKVVYYATAVGGTPATNDPNKWIANQWQTFNPGMYDGAETPATSDNYSNIAPAYVRDAAHGGTGSGPATFHGSAWEVHFTVSTAQEAQGQFVVLSVGSVSLMASLVVALNGHSATWSFENFSPDDPQVRSGDAGFYQWAAIQFPIADLNAVGADNVFTFGVSAHADGVMYDALRMEITNTSADPAVTGWNDYTYVNGNTNVVQNDAVGLAAQNSFAVPEPGTLMVMGGAAVMMGMRRGRRRVP